MSANGKGDKRRPRSITFEQYSKNFDTIFSKKKKIEKEKDLKKQIKKVK